jgi:uncharacterized membrane protein (UPF0127 family)
MKTTTVKVHAVKDRVSLADRCIVANSFFSRLKGLLGQKTYETGQGLLLVPCNDIHMWFMNLAIDVVFIKKVKMSTEGEIFQITSFRRNLKPWKLLPVRDGRAGATLELPVGTIDRCKVNIGDELCISSP